MKGEEQRFVVQLHKASRIHWDFRLEMDGVLKSWAIPKEPPTQKGVKRLTIQTEDHELSYIDFQGIIPEGQYGAGTVETWDRGTFTLEERSPKEIRFNLKGQKLKGEYILVRFRDNWLLFRRS